jgi:hypothetical protein
MHFFIIFLFPDTKKNWQENGLKEKKVAGIFLPSAIWSNGKVLFWDPVLNLNFQKVATQPQNLNSGAS